MRHGHTGVAALRVLLAVACLVFITGCVPPVGHIFAAWLLPAMVLLAAELKEASRHPGLANFKMEASFVLTLYGVYAVSLMSFVTRTFVLLTKHIALTKRRRLMWRPLLRKAMAEAFEPGKWLNPFFLTLTDSLLSAAVITVGSHAVRRYA